MQTLCSSPARSRTTAAWVPPDRPARCWRRSTGCWPPLALVVSTCSARRSAGQVPDDRSLDAAGQSREVLAKIDRLLAAAGSSREHLLSAQIWLKDIDADFAAMNEVWIDWLPAGCAPARATVQARLASPKVLVEIMVIAARA